MPGETQVRLLAAHVDEQSDLVRSACVETEWAKDLYAFYMVIETTPIYDALVSERRDR